VHIRIDLTDPGTVVRWVHRDAWFSQLLVLSAHSVKGAMQPKQEHDALKAKNTSYPGAEKPNYTCPYT